MGESALTPATGLGHRPGLDGLRAVAVVVVLAFHAGALDGGWVGVDVFFVLSGWLITGLLLAEVADSGRFDALAFWRRRFRRLLPALVVTLAFVALLAVAGAIDLRRRGVIGALTYTTNWLNITGTDGYWDTFAAPDPLQHLWSLAVEEQIYLVWPLVVLVVLRFVATGNRARAIRMSAALVAAGSLAIALYGAAADWSVDRLYQGTDTRASAFAMGALAAGVGVPRLSDRLRHVVVVAAIAVAVWLGTAGGSTSLFAGPIHLVTLCGVVAVTTASSIERGPLCWTPVRRLGVWSYGIYLVHYPITLALDGVVDGIALTLLVLALSTPIAALSHRLVEQPIRRHGLPGRRLVTGLTAAAAVAVTALVVAVPVTPTGLDDLPQLDALVPTPDGTSGDTVPGDSSPSTTAPPGRRVLVIGDSVPALAADELADVADERGEALGVLAAEACVGSPHPQDQFLGDHCAGFIANLRDEIARARPDVVVWWWGGVGATQWWAGTEIDVCSLAGFAAADGQIDWQIGLSGDARPVVVVPPARTDLGQRASEAAVCQAAALVDAAGRRDVDILRLDNFMCPDVRDDCERIPRDDGLHVDGDAATTVARWLFDQEALSRQS